MRALLPLITLATLVGCDSHVNVFSLDDDRQLGADLHAQILSTPNEYPLLAREDYPEAYGHLDGVMDQILASGAVRHADDFEWQAYIIHDDSTLNAFAAPGGYLYFYTGLINYLEREDHFAGVFAHEAAHVDRRHATVQLTNAYGLSTLVDLLVGENTGILGDVAESLVSLQFSRAHEFEADEYSVRFLCPTEYAADGTAGFFEKLLEESGEGVSVPAFLSTHPDSQERVDRVHAWAEELGCTVEPSDNADWAAFQAALP
ncbi:MAG: M48 family metalloprotease [Deltaproteobacteria bacterium]|nr:M48 family metalloprotease [Deltaproteobacteria bacterium]